MNKPPGASQRASNLQSTSFTLRRKSHPCSAHLSLSATHRRKLDTVLTHVANCEKPLSLRDPHEDDDGAVVQVVTPSEESSRTEAIHLEGTPLGNKLERMMSVMWMCTAVAGCCFLCLTGLYRVIDAMTEAQILFAGAVPFFWSWLQRFRALKLTFGSILGMTLRLMFTAWMLLTSAYQLRTFIFLYDRAVLPIAAIATGVTMLMHWLMRSRSRPLPTELRKTDMDLIAPFLSDEVEAVGKVSLRLSMLWIFISGVLIVPFVQEVMFRGIVAISLGHTSSGISASLMTALTFQANQPWESVGKLLTSIATHTVWGMVIMMTSGNLMYCYAAHMMHNAVLMGVYHYESLIESW